MNKAELIAAIRAEYGRIEAELSHLDERQMAQSGAEGDWSAKDVIIHLTYWQQTVADNLKHILRGEPLHRESGTVDAINSQVYSATHNRPLPEVLADFRESHQHLLAQLQAISENVLNGPNPLKQDQRLWEYVAEDGFEHHREHFDALSRAASFARVAG